MKIIAWNPNGIRSLFQKNPKEIKTLVEKYSPDIVIFDETKGNEKTQDKTEKLCQLPGYKWYWNNSQTPGRHGCAIAVKMDVPVHKVSYGFGSDVDTPPEPEGRLITLHLERCIVVGVYVVNAGSTRLQYKLEWNKKFETYINTLKGFGKPVIVGGDMNVALENIDLCNPASNKNSPGFTIEERNSFRSLLATGWTDTFRDKYPNTVKYTFWNTRQRARERNVGWRIDYFLIDSEHKDLVEDAVILDEYIGSDHCPILVTLF